MPDQRPSLTCGGFGEEIGIHVIASICTFCREGCGLGLRDEDGRVIGIEPGQPASRGQLCAKNRAASFAIDPRKMRLGRGDWRILAELAVSRGYPGIAWAETRKALGLRCLGCSGCPSCSRYVPQDRLSAPSSMQRGREAFQQAASGPNPSATPGQRLQRSWSHTFGGFNAQFKAYGWGGCGHCDRVCPGGHGVLRQGGQP